jgi:hypothetical protein
MNQSDELSITTVSLRNITFNFYFCKWLSLYATSRKVAGSSPDYVIAFFFSIYLILLAPQYLWGLLIL